jgi:two-component system, OmpR family, KDP operon response regulator KdpE
MVASMAFIPKVLVVCNLPNAPSRWGRSITQRLNFILERNPNRAVQHYAETLPDVVILELDSEPLALELIARLRDETAIPLLLLSSICALKFILDAYQAGVDEYIQKPIQPEILLAKIKVWLRHASVVSPGLLDPLSVGPVKLVPAERSLQFEERGAVHLTTLELRLLYCLIGRHDNTVSTEELCQRIWGEGGGDGMKLKNVVYRLRRKIELDPANPRYLLTLTGVGYQFRSS